jgi:serine O-acetyltransferase
LIEENIMSKMSAVNEYRVARWCYLNHLKPVAWLMRSWTYLIHNSYIPYSCEIGQGTDFGYKGIVIIDINAVA